MRPAGGLHQREVAAYELSQALGWDLVPFTFAREDGPPIELLCTARHARKQGEAYITGAEFGDEIQGFTVDGSEGLDRVSAAALDFFESGIGRRAIDRISFADPAEMHAHTQPGNLVGHGDMTLAGGSITTATAPRTRGTDMATTMRERMRRSMSAMTTAKINTLPSVAVVPVASFEYAESPDAPRARTRKVWDVPAGRPTTA